jgi:hypothetical protein
MRRIGENFFTPTPTHDLFSLAVELLTQISYKPGPPCKLCSQLSLYGEYVQLQPNEALSYTQTGEI